MLRMTKYGLDWIFQTVPAPFYTRPKIGSGTERSDPLAGKNSIRLVFENLQPPCPLQTNCYQFVRLLNLQICPIMSMSQSEKIISQNFFHSLIEKYTFSFLCVRRGDHVTAYVFGIVTGFEKNLQFRPFTPDVADSNLNR